MAQRVRLKKRKGRRGPAAKTGFQLAEVMHPRERAMLGEGLAWGLGPLVIALLVAGIPGWRQAALVLVGGWIVIAVIFTVIYPEITERNMLTAGEAGDNTRLQRMAEVQARALGMPAPQVTVSALAPGVLVVGQRIAMPADLVRELSDAEQWALLAHELAHMRCGHTFWLNLMRRSRQASGLLLVPALPAQVVARGLALWEPFADLSADRLALILTRDQKMLGQALLKQVAFQEPEMEISGAEIVEYLQRPGGLQAEGTEVTTHYKLGQLLRDHKDLHERLRQFAAYAGSDGYKRAVAQIEEATARDRAAQKPPGEPPPGPSQPSA